MKIKISELKELGFEKGFVRGSYCLRLTNPNFNWYCDLVYYAFADVFYLQKVKLNINSISELKTFLNFFETE